MTIELEYIAKRMAELGIAKYTLRLKHLILQPNQRLEIDAWQEFFFLTQEVCDVQISSDLGAFDLSADNTNEMQYEHQGLIIIQNTSSATTVHVRMMQVIPLTTNNGN